MRSRSLPIQTNENPDLCTNCGVCCASFPGISSPEDWPQDKAERAEVILWALASGRWAFDCWDGDLDDHLDDPQRLRRILYLRPAIKGDEDQVFDMTFGGPCTFHGPKGCELEPQARPLQCLSLVPKASLEGPHRRACEQTVSKEEIVRRWRPLAAEMEELLAALR